jgi:DUF917 family protein
MKLDVDDLPDLSAGAVFLATGGGGDPYVAQLVAEKALQKFGPVTLLDPDDVDDDAYVVTIGGVGAPTVSLELLPSVGEAGRALDAFEQHVGRKVDAVVSFEIGGGNSLIPICAALEHGVPVVNGDGMGRALPEAQMMTYPISGVCPTPAVAVDYEGNRVTFSTPSIYTYEKQIRAMALTMGGMIIACEHPMTGKQLKASVVPRTITFSMKIGRILREYRGSAEAISGPLAAAFSDSIYGELRHLYSGKVVDSQRKIVGGFDIGEASIESFGKRVPPMTINIKNEFLVARVGDEVVASVPDLISILDFETSAPINAERLRYGQRVAVYGVGCPDFYRSEAALAVVAPRCFGFDFDYVPLEKLGGGASRL